MASLAYTQEDKSEKKDKALALFLTLLVHAGLILFLLYYIITTPIPPYPEPTAPELELDFGGGGGGSGHTEATSTGKELSTDTKVKAPETNTPTVNNDVEPSVAIPSGKSHVTPKKIDTVVRPQEPSVQLVSIENKFKAAKGNATSNASSQGEQGNGGGGNGNSQGSGTGPGTGNGPGGNGKGFNFNLKGRNLLHRPVLNTNNPEQGQIVVGITVDQDGNVTEATPGVRGSTLTDASLYVLVKDAAMKIKFSKSPNDSPEQSGTVTFVFTIH